GNAGLFYRLPVRPGLRTLKRTMIARAMQIVIFHQSAVWHLECRRPHSRMNLLAHSLLIGFLLGISTLQGRADASVEGVVQLPKVTPRVPNTARYQNTIQGEVSPPDSPVAVVYLDGNFPSHPATNGASVQMQQKRYQFAPGIL